MAEELRHRTPPQTAQAAEVNRHGSLETGGDESAQISHKERRLLGQRSRLRGLDGILVIERPRVEPVPLEYQHGRGETCLELQLLLCFSEQPSLVVEVVAGLVPRDAGNTLEGGSTAQRIPSKNFRRRAPRTAEEVLSVIVSGASSTEAVCGRNGGGTELSCSMRSRCCRGR